MFFRKDPQVVAEGIIQKVRMGKGMTASDLRHLVEAGRLRLIVPVDPKVCPWPTPKFFELSKKQAVELMAAYDKAEHLQDKIQYYIRSDDTVVLLRRENADFGFNSVPDREPGKVSGTQDQYL
jgi:hypothetical protein